jgi:hypothetical protein
MMGDPLAQQQSGCQPRKRPPWAGTGHARFPATYRWIDSTEQTFYSGDVGRVTYTEILCKTALNRVQGMPFKWSLNPYVGCTHSCR